MPTGYYVNDFEIYRHDTVIMCGYYMSNTQDGFIGCFGIYQAFFLSYPIFLANNFLASTSNQTVPVREFKEVEVYEKPVMQGTKTSAVAVGILGGNTGGSCVLETIIDMSTFTPIWAYSSGTSGEYSEEMNQITITNNYIVTGGTMFNDYDAVKMRVFMKTSAPDIFSYTSYGTNGYDDVYYFPSNNVPQYANAFPVISNNWQMTWTVNNEVALASFWQYGYPPNYTTYEGVLLHVYDITDMLTIPNVAPLHTLINYDKTNIISRIKDIRYNRQSQALYLLMDIDSQNLTYESITAEIPYPPTPGTFQFHYLSGITRDHLDNFDFDQNYISSGYRGGSLDLALYTVPVGFVPTCSKTDFASAFPTEDFNAKMHTYPLAIYRGNTQPITFTPYVEEIKLSIKCEEKY